MMTPEQRARENIDQLLDACGWKVQHYRELNLSAGRGVAVREFPLKTGFADYALFVDRRIIGAIEAKSEGTPLSGIEAQTAKYSVGLPSVPPAWHSPLPFLYEKAQASKRFSPADLTPTRANVCGSPSSSGRSRAGSCHKTPTTNQPACCWKE